MNGVELRLLDLLREGEAPLYPAYRWLGRQLGKEVSMTEYLRLVDGLLDQDSIHLWSVDPATQRRESLQRTPANLADEYRAHEPLNGTFDPFGFSMTLAESTNFGEPEWEIDVDFEAGTFTLRAEDGVEERALQQLSLLFPDVRFSIGDRRVVLSGRLVSPNGTIG